MTAMAEWRNHPRGYRTRCYAELTQANGSASTLSFQRRDKTAADNKPSAYADHKMPQVIVATTPLRVVNGTISMGAALRMWQI
jgi:hypothetical protein